MSLGFCLLSLVTARWQFYLILSTIGFGLNAMGELAIAVGGELVRSRAWHRVATMGISLSGVLMPVLSALLVEAVGVARGVLGLWRLYRAPRTARDLALCESRPEAPGPCPGRG